MARVVSRVPQVLRALAQKELRLITAAGEAYAGEVKRLMTDSPATGRVYGRHQASAPGEPPAVDTGDLRGSIRSVVRLGAHGWEAIVGSTRRRAAWLEFGTRTIRPRPAWRPALFNVLPRLRQLVGGAALRVGQP